MIGLGFQGLFRVFVVVVCCSRWGKSLNSKKSALVKCYSNEEHRRKEKILNPGSVYTFTVK